MARKKPPRNRRTPPEVVERRRYLVGTLHDRPLSPRQIQRLMSTPPPGRDTQFFCLNPETRAPWSLATIKRDVRHLEQQKVDGSDYRPETSYPFLMAQLEEACKRAWEQDNIREVRLNIMASGRLYRAFNRQPPTAPSELPHLCDEDLILAIMAEQARSAAKLAQAAPMTAAPVTAATAAVPTE